MSTAAPVPAPAPAPATPKLTKNELLKTADPTLGGSLAKTLKDASVDRFNEDDEQFMKFHGIYQQDDRDKRKIAKEYIFMIRGRIPGGVVTPNQYLTYDELASKYGNNTLRITTRQSLQWHGVAKKGLGALMKGIHDALSTTIAACGDVARNVMAPPTPATGPLTQRVLADAAVLSDELAPKHTSYHSIWVDGVELNLSDEEKAANIDPLYGRTYLPRKFKTAFAIPPLNDTDILTNCLGFIAISDPADATKLLGYNLTVGGGLGTSHGNKETYPRLADVIGFLTPDQLVAVAKGVVTVHRDFGDRTNRKHARLKYVLAEKGAAWFRAELESRLGFKLQDARPFEFTKQGDLFGWHRQADGNSFLGLYVESGRIKDVPGYTLKSALREVIQTFPVESRLTAAQNFLLVNVKPADQAGITAIFAKHGVPVEKQGTAVRRASLACPSMPTCGLGLAESERVIGSVFDRIESVFAELGLGDEEIIIRMTGCPNGCARPYVAEIGLIGRAPGKYNLYLGANENGTRLNRLYKETVKNEELLNEFRTLLTRFKNERRQGERFGDFSHRVILPEAEAAAAAKAAAAS